MWLKGGRPVPGKELRDVLPASLYTESMFWVIRTLRKPAAPSGPAPRASQAASTSWALFGSRRAEVVVEDLLDHGPGLLGVREEVVQLQRPRVVLAPQPARAAEGRDAAFHADPGAGEGSEVARPADDAGSFSDAVGEIWAAWRSGMDRG